MHKFTQKYLYVRFRVDIAPVAKYKLQFCLRNTQTVLSVIVEIEILVRLSSGGRTIELTVKSRC